MQNEVLLNSLYVDPGAKAMDDRDGDISDSIEVGGRRRWTPVAWVRIASRIVCATLVGAKSPPSASSACSHSCRRLITIS